MHESLQSGQLGVMTQHIGGLLQLVVDVILHGLHIMVGLSLISGMLGNAFGSEILRNGTQIRLLIIGERLDTRNDGLIAGVMSVSFIDNSIRSAVNHWSRHLLMRPS